MHACATWHCGRARLLRLCMVYCRCHPLPLTLEVCTTRSVRSNFFKSFFFVSFLRVAKYFEPILTYCVEATTESLGLTYDTLLPDYYLGKRVAHGAFISFPTSLTTCRFHQAFALCFFRVAAAVLAIARFPAFQAAELIPDPSMPSAHRYSALDSSWFD